MYKDTVYFICIYYSQEKFYFYNIILCGFKSTFAHNLFYFRNVMYSLVNLI